VSRSRKPAPPSEPPKDAPGDDRYLVVAGRAWAELREQGSLFRAECIPVEAETEARARVAEIAARFHDATHHCSGFRLGQGDQALRRAHDAGEPAGTAGGPILQAIEGRDLTHTLVVVTRWFGGVKLGTAGLVRSYGAVAAAALDAAGASERFRESEVALRVAHSDLAAAQRAIFALGGRLAAEEYGAEAALTVVVRRSRMVRLRAALVQTTSGRVRFDAAAEEDER
jgi:uncharacterized YigZ family protein